MAQGARHRVQSEGSRARDQGRNYFFSELNQATFCSGI